MKRNKGTRLRYDKIVELNTKGIKVCGYIREMYVEGNVMSGYCSLRGCDCRYEIKKGDQTEMCEYYQRWLKKRMGERK